MDTNTEQRGGVQITQDAILPGTIKERHLVAGAGANNGDLVYSSQGGFTNLGIGSSGQVLEVSGGLPSWQTLPTQRLTLVATQIASASSTISFTSISNSIYNYYKIIAYNITPSNNAVTLSMQISVAGVFQSGASDYEHRQFRFTSAGSGLSGAATATAININSASDTLANTGTGEGMDFDMTVFNCAQKNTVKRAIWNTHYLGSDYIAVTGAGAYLTASNAVDGFRFQMSAGTITTGTFLLYGFS